VIRDLFYRQILERLDDRLDGDTFEICAADLIRRDFPTLVPVRGGSDSGMDGATDSDGPMLICTTGKDVIGNLTKNIEAHLRDNGPRRSAILATSQELTQRRRANLEDKARSLGFTLRHIYDREALAQRLYHEPRWYKELLGLTGRPSALTVIPRTERPLLDHPLVGRDDDLKWLRETGGDRLVVGQPGCGKTYLLRSLALEGWGLFLVDDDPGAIADAVRAQQPGVIIVDDAHSRPGVLPALRQLRGEVDANFDIVATSWEGDREQVAEALSLPTIQIRALGLLTRDEIVEVTRGAGLGGPVELVREIVNQAEGRPGLAVTLSYLSLRGDSRGVYFGDALHSTLGATFLKLVGREANDILAAFALGGERGMTMQAVADALRVSLLELRTPLVRLAAGGVLREDWEKRLSVWPEALRYVLVRDTFFGDKCSLPVDALMAAAPDKASMAETLVGAMSRGAKVPRIIDILEEVGSWGAWHDYASLGKEESRFVLNRHPEMLSEVGQATLHFAPEETLPLLFRAAVGDERNLGNAVDHPLRWVADWIAAAVAAEGDAVPRRRTLVRAAGRWLNSGGDERVALRAACLALKPSFEFGRTDPGGGIHYTLTYGLLADDELEQMGEVWEEVKQLLDGARSPDWQNLLSAVMAWVYPEGRIKEIPPATLKIIRARATRMVADIAEVSREHPGVQQRVCRLANKLRAGIGTAVDQEFEILYPEMDREDDVNGQIERQIQEVSRLAQRWAAQQPASVVPRFLRLEREATLADKRWPRWSVGLCDMLAACVEDPNVWLDQLATHAAPGELVEPFLRKAVSARLPGWEGAVAKCFEHPAYERQAVLVLLTLQGVPDELLRRALDALPRHWDMVELLCLRDQVPEPTLGLLLRHESLHISTTAAVYTWCSEQKGEVREGVRDDWRAAVIRAEGFEYWLPEILKSDKSLAFDWLAERVGRDSIYFSYFVMEEVRAAASVLDLDQKSALLPKLSGEGYGDSELLHELAGDDPRMYAEILRHHKLAKYHLAPLRGHPTGSWADKAILAFEAGYTPEEAVAAAFHFGDSWTGNESDMWQGWIDDFESLAKHGDARVREASKLGERRARANKEEALSKERTEAIYGR
jgi:hypothetical protein